MAVKGHGRLEPLEAVTAELAAVLGRSTWNWDAASLAARVPEVLAWITWAEIREIVIRQAAGFNHMAEGLRGTVDRLASAVVIAIDWHS